MWVLSDSLQYPSVSLMAVFRFRDFFQRFLQKQGSIWPRIVCKSYLRWVFILCNASRFEKKCLGAKTLAKTSFFAQNPLFFCSKSAKSAIFTRRFLRKSHSNFFQLSTTCSLRVLVQNVRSRYKTHLQVSKIIFLKKNVLEPKL